MAKKKEEKTNVMRILDQKKIPYTARFYEDSEGPEGTREYGVHVAQALGQDPALADGAQLSWQVAGLDAAAPEEMGRKILEQSGVRATLDFWGGLCRLEVTLGDGRRLSVLNDGTLECTPGQEDAFAAADLVLDANRPLLEALGGYTRLLPGPNYGRSYSDGSLTESPPVLGKAGDSPAQALFGRDLAVLRSCRTDGEAALTGFTLLGSARAESMGEYPVITREEAEALLCAGSYLDAEFIPVGPGEGTVVSAELCYLLGRSQYYVPMWRFLVDMGVAEAPAQVSEEGADPALHAYREYYVPAIDLDTLTALVERVAVHREKALEVFFRFCRPEAG